MRSTCTQMQNLAADVSPHDVDVGDSVTITSCGAIPGSIGLLWVLDIGGSTGPWLVLPFVYDANGSWSYSFSMPGPTSTVYGLATLAFYKPGAVSFSNRTELRVH